MKTKLPHPMVVRSSGKKASRASRKVAGDRPSNSFTEARECLESNRRIFDKLI